MVSVACLFCLSIYFTMAKWRPSNHFRLYESSGGHANVCPPLYVSFTSSDFNFFFHVQLFAVGIHEFVLKVGEVLVGDDAYAEAVLELPFP